MVVSGWVGLMPADRVWSRLAKLVLMSDDRVALRPTRCC